MRTRLNITKVSRINTGNSRTALSRNRGSRLNGIPGSNPNESFFRILENDDFRLLEDGNFRLLE